MRQERRARLAGQVVAADFYLRQLTFFEVMIDLAGTGGFAALENFRDGEHDLLAIAETPFSRLLGEARRAAWAELDEPPRPEHPPRRYTVDLERFSLEPLEAIRGGQPEGFEAQQAAFEQRHREDAQAQLAWEAAARRAAPSLPAPDTQETPQ